MNAKKWSVLGILFISFILSFSSCNDDCYSYGYGEGVVYVYTEPVIVKSDLGSPVMLHSQYGSIYAPELDTKVKYGDYLLSWFYMDITVNSPYTAIDIEYRKIGVDTATIVQGGLKDDYTDLISGVKIYLLNNSPDKFICVDSTFFVNIEREEVGQNYAYELLAHKDSVDGNGIPSLYLRAKKIANLPPRYYYPDWDSYELPIPYALNLSELLQNSYGSSSGTITFNLKYKSGTNSVGEDIYKDYQHNPVTLTYTK